MRRGQNMISAHRQNQQLILRNILQRPGIARQTLSEFIGLTPASITNLTGSLLRGGWIAEEGQAAGPRTVGRPSIGIRIATGTHYMGAVYLQRRRISVGLAELDGTAVVRFDDELEDRPDPRQTVQRMGMMLEAAIRKVRPPHLLGVGVGASGIVDYPAAVIRVAPRYGWSNVPLGEWLGKVLKVPVVVDNNTRGMALAEQLLSPHREVRWLAFLYIGRGMAAGVWADGRIYRGSRGIGGEVGHTTVFADGERCWCGNRGCLELYLSEDTIRARTGVSEDTPIEQAIEQAPSALREEIVHLVTTALVNLDNIYNPEVVVLGGWVDRAWPILREAVTDELSARTTYWPHPVRVVASSFGEGIGLTGAAVIGLGQLVYGVGEDDWRPPASLPREWSL